MKCFKCDKSPQNGTDLFRQNPKGEIGVWACKDHSKPIDEGLRDLVSDLKQAMLEAAKP